MSDQPKEIDVIVGEDGVATFIWDDDLAALIPEGHTCSINRVSDVEPTADGRWTADMRKAFDRMSADQIKAWATAMVAQGRRPASVSLTLGPFATRAEALLAERVWLREHAGV